jgi:hypothetical protein
LTGVWLDRNNANGGAAGSATTSGGVAGGGGVLFTKPFDVEQSAITGNGVRMGGGGTPALAYGGGIEIETSGRIVNSTVFQNFAAGPTASQAFGGGVDVDTNGTLTLANDTLDGNDAANYGGNLNVGNPGGRASATGTIFANGFATAGGLENCSGHVVTDLAPFRNLEFLSGSSTSQCGLSAANVDLIGIDPMLATNPAFNGGPTETMALAVGSKAIGADGGCIDPSSASGKAPLTVDQRGLPRNPPTCDIGAFQSEKPAANPGPHVSGTPAAGQTLTCVNGTWIGDGPPTFTYLWNGTTPAGATGSTYTVRSGDVQHALSCSVTAHGTYGTTTARSASVTISPAATPPAISHFSQSHRRWRESGKRGRHKPPIGTTFTFTLSASARVTLTFSVRGKRRPLGTLTFAGRKGRNRVKFAGHLGKHRRLKPGSYTVTITAAGASGKPSKPAKLSFKIVR